MKMALFAGTTEGRHIAMVCDVYGINCTVFVATAQGCEGLECLSSIELREGRLDEQKIEQVLKNEGFEYVYDATHPYAREVTDNVRTACERIGCEYIRVVRESVPIDDDAVVTESFEEAVNILNSMEGNILVTTGSKNAADYTKLNDFQNRVYLRTLPDEQTVAALCEMGYDRSHIITGKGPFSEAENIDTIERTESRILVTKDSGRAGGLAEKLSAAKKCGCNVIVVRRPKEEGLSEKAAVAKLIRDSGENMDNSAESTGLKKIEIKEEKPKEKIYIIGIGMGDISLISSKKAEIIRNSDLIIGASRMVDACKENGLISDKTKVFKHFNTDKIAEEAEKNEGKIVILMSGDTGFYSGAKKLAERLGERVEIMPGVSSLSYMSAKIGISWEDVYNVSLHGRSANIAFAVRTHKKTFVLTDGSVNDILKHLTEYGLGAVKVFIGCRLSYPDERIIETTPEIYDGNDTDSLQSLFIINNNYENRMRFISDDEFIRNNTPMTKVSVRNAVVSMFDVSENSIIYDIGAGTGSVSVMLSRLVPEGKVYAFEYKEKACEVISANIKKFSADNVSIVRGKAPESIKNAIKNDIPYPSAVFIGGSEGKLAEIAGCFENSGIRVVISCATTETFGQALQLINDGVIKDSSVMQTAVSSAEPLGKYHIMRAETPVWLVKGTL